MLFHINIVSHETLVKPVRHNIPAASAVAVAKIQPNFRLLISILFGLTTSAFLDRKLVLLIHGWLATICSIRYSNFECIDMSAIFMTFSRAIFKTGNGESGNRGIREWGNPGIGESGNEIMKIYSLLTPVKHMIFQRQVQK